MECESNFSFYVIEGMFYLLGDWILFCGGRGVVGCVCYILMLIGLPCLGGGDASRKDFSASCQLKLPQWLSCFEFSQCNKHIQCLRNEPSTCCIFELVFDFLHVREGKWLRGRVREKGREGASTGQLQTNRYFFIVYLSSLHDHVFSCVYVSSTVTIVQIHAPYNISHVNCPKLHHFIIKNHHTHPSQIFNHLLFSQLSPHPTTPFFTPIYRSNFF